MHVCVRQQKQQKMNGLRSSNYVAFYQLDFLCFRQENILENVVAAKTTVLFLNAGQRMISLNWPTTLEKSDCTATGIMQSPVCTPSPLHSLLTVCTMIF